MPCFDEDLRIQRGFKLFCGCRNRVGISHIAHLESKDIIASSAHAVPWRACWLIRYLLDRRQFLAQNAPECFFVQNPGFQTFAQPPVDQGLIPDPFTFSQLA